MSEQPEKPLHARCAEALGWKRVHLAPEGNLSGFGGSAEPCWIGDPLMAERKVRRA